MARRSLAAEEASSKFSLANWASATICRAADCPRMYSSSCPRKETSKKNLGRLYNMHKRELLWLGFRDRHDIDILFTKQKWTNPNMMPNKGSSKISWASAATCNISSAPRLSGDPDPTKPGIGKRERSYVVIPKRDSSSLPFLALPSSSSPKWCIHAVLKS